MKFLKEVVQNCLGKSTLLHSLIVGSSWNLVYRFIGQMSMIWPLQYAICLQACEKCFFSQEQKHLSVSAFVFRVALENNHFFLLPSSKTISNFPSSFSITHHHGPPLFAIETQHREEPFNRSGIFYTCRAVLIKNEAPVWPSWFSLRWPWFYACSLLVSACLCIFFDFGTTIVCFALPLKNPRERDFVNVIFLGNGCYFRDLHWTSVTLAWSEFQMMFLF